MSCAIQKSFSAGLNVYRGSRAPPTQCGWYSFIAKKKKGKKKADKMLLFPFFVVTVFAQGPDFSGNFRVARCSPSQACESLYPRSMRPDVATIYIKAVQPITFPIANFTTSNAGILGGGSLDFTTGSIQFDGQFIRAVGVVTPFQPSLGVTMLQIGKANGPVSGASAQVDLVCFEGACLSVVLPFGSSQR